MYFDSGNSLVHTSTPVKNIPFILSSPDIKNEVNALNNTPRNRKRNRNREHDKQAQSNKLTNYFLVSPKNQKPDRNALTDIISISDNSDESVGSLEYCSREIIVRNAEPDIIVISDDSNESTGLLDKCSHDENEADSTIYECFSTSEQLDITEFLEWNNVSEAKILPSITSTTKENTFNLDTAKVELGSSVEICDIQAGSSTMPVASVDEELFGTGEHGRLSITQLCRYFSKPRSNEESVARRLNVRFSTSAATHEAWKLCSDEVDVIATEIKVKEWHFALNDCLQFTNDTTFMPSFILQQVMQNALHSHEADCVSLSLLVLYKTLQLHPAYSACVQDNYSRLLQDNYIVMSAAYPKCNVAILDQLLGLISNLCTSDCDISDYVTNKETSEPADLEMGAMARVRHANNVFATLCASEKMGRVCLLMDFVVTLLEQDAVSCASLISQLIWPDCARWNIGYCNVKCRDIFHLLRCTLDFPVNSCLLRLVSVMAECVLRSDSNRNPMSSERCAQFARSIFLATVSSCDSHLPIFVARLKPYWLQLLVVQLAAPLAQLK